MSYVPSRFARLVLVTGPAGSGRTTAINALEDLGYEAIDNLPLSLVPSVARPSELQKPLAIGLDCRNREFSPEGVLELLVTLCQTENLKTELLYLSCEPEVLLRRYSETRRRHPMAPEETPRIGIAKELLQLDVIRKSADVLLDTTSFSPHDLRREVSRWFSPKKTPNLTLGLESFSYKRGIPSGLDSIFDVRFLKNPHWDVALRNETGRSATVQDFIRSDPRFEPFLPKNHRFDPLAPSLCRRGEKPLCNRLWLHGREASFRRNSGNYTRGPCTRLRGSVNKAQEFELKNRVIWARLDYKE